MIRRCKVCSCTDMQACPGGCWWVGDELCSSCERDAAAPMASARISRCGKYRYTLERKLSIFPIRGPAIFCMLNPSTADADVDDPTIRRCRGFADDWGCSRLIVVNLFALRSTDPAALRTAADPVGPDNDQVLHEVLQLSDDVVCAWGAHAPAERVDAVVKLFRSRGKRMHCLGTTKAGAPRHPLYVPKAQRLVPWTPAAEGCGGSMT